MRPSVRGAIETIALACFSAIPLITFQPAIADNEKTAIVTVDCDLKNQSAALTIGAFDAAKAPSGRNDYRVSGGEGLPSRVVCNLPIPILISSRDTQEEPGQFYMTVQIGPKGRLTWVWYFIESPVKLTVREHENGHIFFCDSRPRAYKTGDRPVADRCARLQVDAAGTLTAGGRAGFDCDLAGTPVELAICRTGAAITADSTMADAFVNLVQKIRAGTNQKVIVQQIAALESDQRAWLLLRSATCLPRNGGGDASAQDSTDACLVQMSRDRMRDLGEWLATGMRPPGP